jgi:hypothetical protein
VVMRISDKRIMVGAPVKQENSARGGCWAAHDAD